MGYLIVPDIKKEDVLCQQPCKHTDCAAMRRDFIDDNKCKICGEELKPGDLFYYTEYAKTPKTHFRCAD